MKHRLAVLASILLMSSALFAQTTYDSISGATINPPRITFIFGHAPNGTAGTTELVVQCDFQRAWLITNFDVPPPTKPTDPAQAMSQFFPITCTENSNRSAYTLNGTPFDEVLTMTNMLGQVTGTINLTVVEANWQLTTQHVYRWSLWLGNSEIAF